jgi:signal transduction histidine kinase
MADAAPAAAPQTGASRRPRGLSRRVAWLTAAIVLLVEASVFLPKIAHVRVFWFNARMTEARIAALSAVVAPAGGDQVARDALLRQAGLEAIRLDEAGGVRTVLAPGPDLPAPGIVDLERESQPEHLERAVVALLSDDDRLVSMTAPVPQRPGATVTVVLHRRALHASLLNYARRDGVNSLLEAGAVGLLLYIVMLELLVRPMRRLTDSIVAFRADPERVAPADGTPHPDDEIGAAARELAAMQAELRTALWRNARLAALGTALAKISHDMRGILAPALLTAERLQMSQDASVKRAGDVLVRTVERATELVRRTVEFSRDTPTALPKRLMALRPAAEEAAEQARASCRALTVENAVPDDILIEADSDSMVRVLANLLRNAGEAGALRARMDATLEQPGAMIIVSDDGPGLPQVVRAALFQPFVSGGRRGGIGLGLAIARDLMRAHGGDVALMETSPTGTRFALTLPARREPADAPPTPASAHG